jgi:hypothetical protein
MMNEKEDYKIHANKDTSLSLSLSNPVRRGSFEDPC